MVDFFNKEKTIKLSSNHGDESVTKPKIAKELVRYVERGQYSFNWHPEFGNDGFGLIMFHRGIYERVVASIGERVPYGQKESYKALLGKRITVKVDDKLKGKDDPLEKIHGKMLLKVTFFNIDRSAFYNTALLGRAFDLVEAGSMTQEDLVDLLIQFDLICTVMSHMRKLWVPQAGAGSQSTEYKLHMVMAEASKQVMKDWYDRIEEDTDSDPTEETIHWWG